MKKIKLFFLLMCAWVKTYSQVLMLETFTNNQLPPGWYQDSAGSVPVNGWRFNTIQTPGIIGGGFDNHFLKIEGLWSRNIDAYLVTDTFNSSSLSTVYLSYGEYYVGNTNISVSKIDVSNDNGTSWHNVLNNTNTHGGINGVNAIAITNIVDISQYAAGFNNVKIRFGFSCNNNGGPGWFLDSVRVSDYEACNIPPDSGYTTTQNSFACTGSPINLWLENLSRGAGQTYQWQYKNSSTGNVWSNIAGATYDTLNNFIQNGTTSYQCIIGCSTFTENSIPLLLTDVPNTNHTIEANGYYAGICPGSYDSLRSLANNTIPGTGYQWAWSPTYNGTYTNITGATSSYYLLTDTNTLQWFYKCRQTCVSNGTNNLSSNNVQSYFNPHPYCYCLAVNSNRCNDPLYFTGSINNVTIAGTGLNNSSGCNTTLNFQNVYTYFAPAATTTATLTQGNTYTMSVTIDTMSIASSIDVWIDYDHNLFFDTYENTEIAYGATGGSITTANVTIPAWALTGLTGMRVRTQPYFFLADSTSGCAGMAGGETEDYMITIDSTVGIVDWGFEIGDVRLMPNPAQDKLTITALNFTPTNNAQFIITDLTGRILQQEIFTGTATINTTALTPAVYFVTVQDKERSVVRRFVKAP
ncbi:MAG TPA: GEVED domain-containing protein [Bacteroidia bacterium]|nr:GEVED domain-containing protein [Bacteroidia bacterium]